MGKNIWAFGPAARLVQKYLQSFQSFPPRGAEVENQREVEKQVSAEDGMSRQVRCIPPNHIAAVSMAAMDTFRRPLTNW